MSETPQLTFGNLQELRRWLIDQGYDIGKNTLYNHNGPGQLQPDAEGRYHADKALKYAQANLKRKDGQKLDDDATARRKAKADLIIKEAVAEKTRFQTELLKGRYITKDDHVQILTERARALRVDLSTFFRQFMEDLIELCEGNPDTAPEVLAFCESSLDKWLNRYAETGRIGEPV